MAVAFLPSPGANGSSWEWLVWMRPRTALLLRRCERSEPDPLRPRRCRCARRVTMSAGLEQDQQAVREVGRARSGKVRAATGVSALPRPIRARAGSLRKRKAMGIQHGLDAKTQARLKSVPTRASGLSSQSAAAKRAKADVDSSEESHARALEQHEREEQLRRLAYQQHVREIRRNRERFPPPRRLLSDPRDSYSVARKLSQVSRPALDRDLPSGPTNLQSSIKSSRVAFEQVGATKVTTLKHATVPVLAPVPEAADGKQKPFGYWTNILNMQAELEKFHASRTDLLNPSSRPLIPVYTVLLKAGRSDLHSAMRRLGGREELARQLKMPLEKVIHWRHKRKVDEDCVGSMAPLSSKPASSPVARRKPPGFWQSFEMFGVEFTKYVNEHCDGVMPSFKKMREDKQYSLIRALKLHGGVEAAHTRLGIPLRVVRKRNGFWKDRANVESELNDYLYDRVYRLGTPLPPLTTNELIAQGRGTLAKAIAAHGGWASFPEGASLLRRKAKTEACETENSF
ncbi:hypothetical protein FVE85_6125 [Porphyridium purpureum]|uniref:Uncharacterized protein n=1 Tax=Porphyridium purpureum TaxID=35688 RepID=A0A5J4Z5M0_PORPP|nr:hypothetical protein FVE85_6125 [Porphyridium purpureum]|eukprot:POR3455..scf295_1